MEQASCSSKIPAQTMVLILAVYWTHREAFKTPTPGPTFRINIDLHWGVGTMSLKVARLILNHDENLSMNVNPGHK